MPPLRICAALLLALLASVGPVAGCGDGSPEASVIDVASDDGANDVAAAPDDAEAEDAEAEDGGATDDTVSEDGTAAPDIDPPDTEPDDTTPDVDVADGSGSVADADEPDVTDPDVADVTDSCGRRVSATVDDEAVALWRRVGGVEVTARVEVALDGEPCGSVDVASNATWLDASWVDGGLAVTISDPEWIGIGRAEVALLHDDRAQLLATVDVVARSFPAPSAARAPHVLVVGLDGVRSDAMLAADTPTFDALASIGAWTLDGRTHEGTTDSGVGWTSLYTGVGPDRHLVTGNGAMDARDWDYPTFAWTLRNEHAIPTAMVGHWLPAVATLHEVDAFDDTHVGDDAAVSRIASSWLEDGDARVVLTHFDDVDHAGHADGFSPLVGSYMAAIETVDEQVAPLVDAVLERTTLADEAWLIAVVTDHGGEGTSHGARTLTNQRIPFIFAGSIDVRGAFTGDAVTHMDLSPTVLGYMGVDVDPDAIDGRDRLGPDEPTDPLAQPPTTEATCDDRMDDDGDRQIDCDDPDCDVAEACAPVCAERSIGSASGAVIATGTNDGEDTDFVVDCARLPGAADVSFEWSAPIGGTWVIDTSASDYDTVLAVFDGACPRPGARIACNDDADGLQSAVTIDAEADRVFTIVISGFDGATGTWALGIVREDD